MEISNFSCGVEENSTFPRNSIIFLQIKKFGRSIKLNTRKDYITVCLFSLYSRSRNISYKLSISKFFKSRNQAIVVIFLAFSDFNAFRVFDFIAFRNLKNLSTSAVPFGIQRNNSKHLYNEGHETSISRMN